MHYPNKLLWNFFFAAGLFVPLSFLHAQSADTLRNVHRIFVASLGSYNGADELKRDLVRYLKKTPEFEMVSSPAQADAVLEGRAELWVRGYHSLSPRARANPDFAEPIYGGYLSVRLRGKDGEILWSYFADPRRVSVHELSRDLVDEVVTRLKQEHNQETTPNTIVSNANDIPATLRGGGATFPFPLYQEWFNRFHNRHPAWTFLYSPVGSEQGIADLNDGKLDFAGSDIAPEALPETVRSNNDFFPSVGGAVVLVYNLPNFVSELHLTADVIADIYSGSIRNWNDPRLAALNPSAPLPSAPIQLFHRTDGSGTTFAFTDFLTKVSPAWAKSFGAKSRLQWNVGTGINGNEEMTSQVAATPYSLGYTEFIYAFNHHLNFASVKNMAGRFILPDLLSIMAAANWAGDKPADLSLSIVNSPEASAYPISTITWLVVPHNQAANQKVATSAFLDWLLTSGQRQCSGLGYAPLPRNVLDRELSAIRKIR